MNKLIPPTIQRMSIAESGLSRVISSKKQGWRQAVF